MFSFEPIDRRLYNSLATDDNFFKHVEQRFVMHFGDKTLNNRFFVVLSQENIRFFYYDDINPSYDGILNRDDLKELGCVSLTNPKDTGNDILRFPQMSCGEIKNKPTFDDETKKAFPKLFYRFPFWNDDSGDDFKAIVKCCLLSFVFKIEDRNEIFAYSPLYDYVRTNLRRSDIYLLLSAKIQYTLYIPQNGLAYNYEEYSYKAGKFADCLMDKRINKVISPHDYPSEKNKKIKTQSWFNNPEEELDALLEQNRRQIAESPKESKTILADSLELKIRDFMYTKHAVSQAMTRSIGKRLFWIGQILMVITSLLFFAAFIAFIKSGLQFFAFLQPSLFAFIIKELFPVCAIVVPVGCFFVSYIIDRELDNNRQEKAINIFKKKQFWLKAISVFILLIVVALTIRSTYPWTEVAYTWFYSCFFIFLLILIGVGGYLNNAGTKGRGGVLYVFFPRIVVAELVAWLMIGISEDLVKSMLWGHDAEIVLAAIILVLLLISLIVYGEVKQHSPYLRTSHIIFTRILPIVNHSLFFALIMGILFQVLFYNALIKNSDVMSSVVFSSYFAEADYYRQNLEDLDKTIRQYEDFCHTSISVTGKGEAKQKVQINDTANVETTTKVNQEFKLNVSLDRRKSHNSLINQINNIIDELQALNKDMGIDYPLLNNDTLQVLKESDTTDKKQKVCMEHNREVLYSLPTFLHKEIRSVRKSTIMFNNYETLMNWAIVGKAPIVNTGSLYLNGLTEKVAESNKCCQEIKITIGEKYEWSVKIFPILLILHTLIVLVIAFVTQLIISEKSVTQPL